MLDLAKKYIDNRIQLIKMELISGMANVGAGLISSFLVLIIGMFTLFMLSAAAAFWLGQHYDNNALGFLIVGGVYILVLIIYMVFSKDAIGNKIKDQIVKAAYKGGEELTENHE